MAGQDLRPRIGLDGFNLALEQGTGIATYSRNLSYVLRDLGAFVDVLYGRNMPPRRLVGGARQAEIDLLQEIAFFDPKPLLAIESYAQGAAWAARTLAPLKITEAPIRGGVVADDFQDRMPAFDRILNSRNLFVLAHNHFQAWGRLLRVRAPDPPQVMHWTYPIPIEMVGARNIYTVHDLVPLRLPHTTLDHKKRYLKMVKLIGRRADHIVTVSETSKADIQEIMGIGADKVTNTYQAVNFGAQGLRTAAQARSEVAGAVGLPHQGYFLFFGAVEPKKNVGRLIEGFLTANVKTPLLLVGKAAWKSEQELRLLPLAERRRSAADEAEPVRWSVRQGLAPAANAAGSARRERESAIIRLDYVPYSMLISLIRGAKAVVFPSIYEGFGLPVLEAMQLGVPVITSNVSSLPEVAGDAALLVDPYDPRAIGEAVRRLDTDAGLRDDLTRRGLRQAARFTPEAYRGRLADLYGRLGVQF